MSLTAFTKIFPHIKPAKGNKKDYDPAFWNDRIRFCLFANSREIINDIEFTIFLTFKNDTLSFLQYFGRTESNSRSFRKSRHAFNYLKDTCSKFSGDPSEDELFPGYGEFTSRVRVSNAPPDERNVPIAYIDWDGMAFLHVYENAYNQIVVDFRMEDRH
ncbi:MAG: hypothetical protein JW969_12180 [Spirochaetales bacterium]|nr:hypothetical protein [Spirochaetales bacterium]